MKIEKSKTSNFLSQEPFAFLRKDQLMEINRNELRKNARKQLKGNWLWVIGLLIIPGIINLLLEYVTNYIWTGSFNTDNLFLVSWWRGLGWSIFTIITGLIATMIAWGVQYATLAFRDTGEKPNIFKAMFSSFTNGYFSKTFLTSLLTTLFTFFWGLLLIIPGIIKRFSYAMAPYIMKDMIDSKHEMTVTEAISESRKVMKGNKTTLFIIWLTFNIWYFIIGLAGIIIAFLSLKPFSKPMLADIAFQALFTFLIAIILIAIINFLLSLYLQPYYRQTVANFYRTLVGDKYLKKEEN
ncbi:DUF975 family protein [Lactobacillus taiwanensis]|uniref:DUF975 family protein n=1 Tax=Lactobacillus taiwanensis TaxID=508451 RepID=UPI0020A67908|nr:DUF975 family protein [Lactobacillus taiwanensis]MCR1902935.1 DUF975 family protein [Lactobacillus taiwanensis]